MDLSTGKIWNGWPRNLICMWFAQLAVCTGFSSAFAFIPLYLAEDKFGLAALARQLGTTHDALCGYYASWFNFFGLLAFAIFTPIWGALSDRWGVKIMLYRGSFLTAFIYPLLGMASNVYVLIFLRFVTGALSGTTIAAQMLIVKTTPDNKQGFCLGALGTAVWGGYMVGEPLGGLVVARWGYMAAFALCGVLFFISGLFSVLARDSEKAADRPAASETGERMPFAERFRQYLRIFVPAVMTMLTVFMLCGLCHRFSTPYTSLMVKRFVNSAREAAYWTGIIGGLAAMGSVLAGFVMGTLSDKVREWKLTTPMQLASALMLFLCAGATTLFVFGFCHAANSLALGGMYSIFQKVISSLVERVKRGAVLGWATTMYNAGYMLSSVISGALVKYFDLPVVYYIGAALVFALALVSCFAIRFATRQRDARA